MRDLRAGFLVACLAVLLAGSCGGGSTGPTPPPGNGGQQPPPVINTPPQVKSIAMSDARAEATVPLTLTATVEDVETPAANLTYVWSADVGTFAGTGAVVTWVAGPTAKTPADVVLTLIVTEKYGSGATAGENKVTSTTTVHVNNSPKELADMSLRFLGDFGNSSISPDKCVAEFSDTCARDKKDELEDITNDRHDFLHLSSSCTPTSVSISGDRRTATVHTFCSYTVRVISKTPQSGGCVSNPGACPFGGEGTARGDYWTTGVYENGRWWICASHYTPSGSLTPLARAFAGLIDSR
jgi:hypothetical protein